MRKQRVEGRLSFATTICFSVMICTLFLTSTYSRSQDQSEAGNILKHTDNFHFCHRCGMAVKKTDTIVTVTGVPEAPWYQCCPMCALMDVIEVGQGNGLITAHGDSSQKKIEIRITGAKIERTEPTGTLIHVGGSCSTNKIFINRDQAKLFISKTAWAEEKKLKPVSKIYTMLSSKKKSINRCSMCTTELKGHANTWFTIMTTKKKRMVACCSHCGLFLAHKLKDEAKRVVTPDFKTGTLLDAKQAVYVVDNDLTICCLPSTMSFEKVVDAEAFQKEHGGEILTFQQAMANIKKVMKK